MTYLTPPLWAKGRFQTKNPFTVATEKVYQCIALRNFDDIVAGGELVFETYYEPAGLDRAIYQEDNKNKAVIITLVDEFGNTIYLPNSYLLAFPNMGDVPYHHLVLSTSLGPVPEYLDTSTLEESILESVVATTGIANAEVKIHIAPARSGVSPDQHETLEANRLAGITYSETYKSKWLKAEAEKVALEEKNTVLTAIIVDAGLV